MSIITNKKPIKNYIHIDDVYKLIAGHNNYHGDDILSALTCLSEGKIITHVIRTLDELKVNNEQ